MQYSDQKVIQIGDRVALSNGEPGEVVFSIDTNEYSIEFPKSEWDYLSSGVMVRTMSGVLIHISTAKNEELSLVHRANET